MLGRHLSNIGDHRKPHAETLYCYSFEAMLSPERRRQEWQYHLDWINRNVIGPPKATDHYTQEQLEAIGMLGIYAPTRVYEAAPQSTEVAAVLVEKLTQLGIYTSCVPGSVAIRTTHWDEEKAVEKIMEEIGLKYEDRTIRAA